MTVSHFLDEDMNTMPGTASVIAYGEQDNLWHKRNQSKYSSKISSFQ